ncbi:putative bifunctional diguanylate cyclase/phosphodiesterase [Rhodocyclus tenuis]|uniref:Diguanylate cyclase (GGDEF)-like protein/PAS domain S-box-containing protein n=1 Tax=Rhodocyclus tenuis TaxID=1066 RepID=A0A840G562_RHOTE|nr:bifunctional diguanylate cyclase/phosphodiesterase [Rhodocyclus tenuis]MBB4247045.1 diguanylate cyclase (GGDEF)-like protein/PAS domain S-box-containing protein [Rhodocyclus tenuis]MBK1679489.1 hypothetical protein [Rhodocyclus tenuis]
MKTLPLGKGHSILYIAAVAVVSSAIGVGLIFIGITAWVTHERAQQQTSQRLGELLGTVESTASIACFVEDQALARELARGLLKNSEALAVVIRSNSGELASARRSGVGEIALARAAEARIRRPIVSPFNSALTVGEILLDPDPEAVERTVIEEVRFIGILLWLLLAALVSVIAFVMLRQIVRPIQGLSLQLHRMDAAAGDRLAIGRVDPGAELGGLVADVNALADQLVASLDDERKLRIQREFDEKKYRAIFDNAETGIFIARRDGVVESRNPALARLFELPAYLSVDSAGISLLTLPWQQPSSLPELLARCVDENLTLAADLEFLHGDGNTRWLNVVLSPIGDERVQGVVSNVTERRQAEDSARHQAVTDPLTGIANRPGLEQQLQAEMQHCTSGSENGFAFLLIDLDGFKRINDALGLPVGDSILKAASSRILSCLKDSDIVARMGGDEFAAILPRIDDEALAASVGERIVRALRRSYDGHGTPIQLGASIGITLFPGDGADLPTLLRNAELALDRAKASGGGRFSFFDPAMAETAERRRTLETDMQLALRRNEFKLFLQPVVDLSGKRVVGAEALIRWQHHEKGLIVPDAFIPLAEETGLIVDIGLWCLEEACLRLAEWQREGRDLYLSLNISARQIPEGLPPAVVLDAVRRHGVDASRLVLEITEGVLLADVGRSQSWLRELRESGFRIYLDDFGTGYSSLSYLKRFPVDTVKIDKSFIRDLNRNENDRALVEAIIAMARSLRLQVVAEGVEDAEQLAQLRQMGCNYIQGYHFSMPVCSADFAAAAESIARSFLPENA